MPTVSALACCAMSYNPSEASPFAKKSSIINTLSSDQDGRQRLEEAGLTVSSLCKVASLTGNKVTLLGEDEANKCCTLKIKFFIHLHLVKSLYSLLRKQLYIMKKQLTLGLYDIAQQAKAETVGIGIVVEKSFQDGRQRLEEAGYFT
jgi:hypothetical protein